MVGRRSVGQGYAAGGSPTRPGVTDARPLEPLRHAAERAAADPFYAAHWLARHAAARRLTPPQLAARVGATPDGLVRLGLWRAARSEGDLDDYCRHWPGLSRGELRAVFGLPDPPPGFREYARVSI